ncbi:MAG: M67 family metallopeptidase [Actinomycetota bacterium]|nr:M67 family metallopeptidase [Actinomycetota bacterium]
MTPAITLSRRALDEMIEHCESGRPNEACGLLAGRHGRVERVIRMTNAAESPVRYALDPKEQFDAYQLLDREGFDLAGVFHSHTRTEAFPSPTDVRLATEDVPYVIVSLAASPAEVRAFRIVKANWNDEAGEVQEVPVEIDG